MVCKIHYNYWWCSWVWFVQGEAYREGIEEEFIEVAIKESMTLDAVSNAVVSNAPICNDTANTVPNDSNSQANSEWAFKNRQTHVGLVAYLLNHAMLWI